MSTEYVFFDAALRDRFVGYARARQAECLVRPDPMEGFVVGVPDDLADALSAALEAEYESLMNEQMLLAESREDWGTRRVAGVPLTLADGRACVVRLPPEVARTLLEHLAPEDIHALVASIAHSIEHPDTEPLCKKV